MPKIIVCMPVFNEAGGITHYLDELFHSFGKNLVVVVADDCSSDETALLLSKERERRGSRLVVLRNMKNLGHGPTLLRALRFACETTDLDGQQIITVDGDGQISGKELFRFWERSREWPGAVWEGQRQRTGYREELHRQAASIMSRWFVRAVSGAECSDANTPVRIYPQKVLAQWLDTLPEKRGRGGVRIPNVLFSIFARRHGEVRVETVGWRQRLGSSPVGSTWSSNRLNRVLKFGFFALHGAVELTQISLMTLVSKR